MAGGGLLLAAVITDRRRQCGLDEYILIRMAAEGFAAVSSVWRHFNEEKFFWRMVGQHYRRYGVRQFEWSNKSQKTAAISGRETRERRRRHSTLFRLKGLAT